MGYPKNILASNSYDSNFGPLRSNFEEEMDDSSYERLLLKYNPLELARKKILPLSLTELVATKVPYAPTEGYVIPAENSVEFNHTIPVPFSLSRVEAVLFSGCVPASMAAFPLANSVRSVVNIPGNAFFTTRSFAIAFSDYTKTIGQVGENLNVSAGFSYIAQATYADVFGRHGLDRLLPAYLGSGSTTSTFPLEEMIDNTYSILRTVWIDKEQNAVVFRYKKVTAQGYTIPSTFVFPLIPIF